MVIQNYTSSKVLEQLSVHNHFLYVFQEEHTQSRQERGAITSTLDDSLLPRSDQCDKRSRKSYRVTFGQNAPLSAYPWIAMLGYKSKEGGGERKRMRKGEEEEEEKRRKRNT